MELNLCIEKIIYYAEKHLDLDELDALYLKNIIFNKLNINEPTSLSFDKNEIDNLTIPDILINELKESLLDNQFDNVDNLITQIMGLVSPLPSIIKNKIYELEKEQVGKGLDYLFNLQIQNGYIKKTAIEKNIYFKKEFENNFLEITINLSKPEKNNKDIAKLISKPVSKKYPKCLLCEENLGFGGNDNHPCRTDIRILPIKLNNQDWFLQYSPYAYFDHHSIIINKEHRPMVINHQTFKNLIEFVDKFPIFFVGSNADLPIVGGSILDHEHYQGGLHLLPMFYSHDKKVLIDNDIKVSILDWYNSVIKIEGEDKNKVLDFANKIFDNWIKYENKELNIIPFEEKRCSTVTPLARKVGNKYLMFLILRNNRTSEEYPDGIFHAHKEYHNIKQEGIGLIEATGLFILPPRLKRQMQYIEEILTTNDKLETYYEKYPDLIIHKDMINDLLKMNSRNQTLENAKQIINDKLAEVCKNILFNTAVFKDDEKGNKAFEEFILSIK